MTTEQIPDDESWTNQSHERSELYFGDLISTEPVGYIRVDSKFDPIHLYDEAYWRNYRKDSDQPFFIVFVGCPGMFMIQMLIVRKDGSCAKAGQCIRLGVYIDAHSASTAYLSMMPTDDEKH